MASKQGLPPSQRFKRTIDCQNEQKEASIKVEMARHQDEALKLGRNAIKVSEEVKRHSAAPPIPQRPQRPSRSGGRTISEPDSDSVTSETSRPAPLPTPPTSPVTSKYLIQTASAASSEGTVETQDIAYLHTSLQDCQREIHSLNLELDATKQEFQRFRDERREASREHLRAVRKDAEEEIKRYEAKEERLARIVEQKEQMIERLENEIDERGNGKGS